VLPLVLSSPIAAAIFFSPATLHSLSIPSYSNLPVSLSHLTTRRLPSKSRATHPKFPLGLSAGEYEMQLMQEDRRDGVGVPCHPWPAGWWHTAVIIDSCHRCITRAKLNGTAGSHCNGMTPGVQQEMEIQIDLELSVEHTISCKCIFLRMRISLVLNLSLRRSQKKFPFCSNRLASTTTDK
jgi:hypothetical protein